MTKKRSTPGSKAVPWTQFMDMHSGGGQKLEWSYVYIQAPQKEAEIVFQHRFKRNPHRVTCTCCGPDYSISESPTLEQATGYERGCDSVYVAPDGNIYTEDDWYGLPIEKRRGLEHRYMERAATRRFSKEYMPLDKYLAKDTVHVVMASTITAAERKGKLRREGYVWESDDE